MKRLVSAAVVMAVVMAMVPGVVAATYLDYGWPNRTVSVSYGGGTSTAWSSLLDTARADVSNSGAGLNISRNQLSGNSISVMPVSPYPYDADLGNNHAFTNGSNLVQFEIRIYEDKINAYCILYGYNTASQKDLVFRSTAAHELCHSFWLGDLDAYTDSLMYKERDRTRIYRPTVIDTANINYKYQSLGIYKQPLFDS